MLFWALGLLCLEKFKKASEGKVHFTEDGFDTDEDEKGNKDGEADFCYEFTDFVHGLAFWVIFDVDVVFLCGLGIRSSWIDSLNLAVLPKFRREAAIMSSKVERMKCSSVLEKEKERTGKLRCFIS